MNTIHYLSDPGLRGLYWPGVLAGLAIALMAAPLSVMVVLKRLAFIGQGVSHAAFGGIGTAAVLGALAPATLGAFARGPGQFAVVLVFCLLSGLVIAWMSRRKSTSGDTAIGIVLVASMAIGAVLLHVAAKWRGSRQPSWESVLFGSILEIDARTAMVTWMVALAVLVVVVARRRALLMWTFDEATAPAFGVESGRVRLLVMAMLTLAVVLSMRLAGVVLSTALLVLPGAAALASSVRLERVMGLATMAAVVGVVGGLVVCFELDWPPGPSVVLVLAVVYAAARGVGSRWMEA